MSIIAIKTEMDSRPIVYPLLRVLSQFGSICVISDNNILNRLIDDEDEGGFRNIRVIVEESGAVDTVYEEWGIVPSEFDFVILDNMGAIDYDYLIVGMGYKVTDEFQDYIDLMKKDARTAFIQMGKSDKPAAKKDRPKRAERPRPKRRGQEEEELLPEDDDPAAKFTMEVSDDEEYNVSERFYNCEFPNWQDLEKFESTHAFYKVDQKIGDAIYEIFKTSINIEKRVYDRANKAEDDGDAGHLRARYADLETNPKKRR